MLNPPSIFVQFIKYHVYNWIYVDWLAELQHRVAQAKDDIESIDWDIDIHDASQIFFKKELERILKSRKNELKEYLADQANIKKQQKILDDLLKPNDDSNSSKSVRKLEV